MKRVQIIFGTIAIVFSVFSTSIAGINEWTSIGPPGLWTKAIAVDPSNPDVVYVGCLYGNNGLYKTTDGGTRWEKMNNGLGNLSIQCIVINPRNTDILYVGTTRGGVFKSLDAGQSWVPKNEELIGGRYGINVQCMAIDPQDPNRLFIGQSANGLYRSVDGGDFWERSESVVHIYPRDIEINSQNPDVIYTVTDFPPENFVFIGGVAKSTDGGDTWNDRLTNRELYGKSFYSVNDIAIDPNDPETIYIGATSSSSGYNSIYRSTDGGKHWTNINNNMNSIFTISISLDPVNSTTIYAVNMPFFGVSGGLYRSIDSGENWSRIENGLTTNSLYKIVADPVNSDVLYLGGYYGGLFKTVNGGENWINITDPINMKANSVQRLAIDPENPSIIFACAYRGLFKTTDRGLTWDLLQEGLPNYFYPRCITFDPRYSQRIYLGTSSALYITEDGGQSWVSARTGLEYLKAINTIVVSPHDSNGVYIGTSEGIFVSHDNGWTWDRPSNPLNNQFVNNIIIHPDDLEIWYVSTREMIFKTTNAGRGWTEKMSGLVGDNYHVKMDPNDPNILYINNYTQTLDGGIFKSVNGGDTWEEKNTGISNVHGQDDRAVAALVIDAENSNILFCSDVGDGRDHTGIYMSTNGANSWISIETDLLENNSVWDLQIDPLDHNTLYAATKGASIATYTRADVDFVLGVEDKAVFQNSRDNKIHLTLQNSSEICHLQADILFDTTCFHITSIEQTDRARVTSMFFYSAVDGGIRIVQSSISGCIDIGEGPVVEIVFDAGDCSEGYYPWNIDNAVLGDPLGREISPLCKDGKVAILSGPKGDINNDSAVNALDVVLAVKIATGLYPNATEEERLAADCNLDGEIDVTDVLMIVNVITGLGSCPP